MAMSFQPASRAAQDDLVAAVMAQAQLEGQKHAADQANKQGYYSAGATLAQAAPEGAWGNLGNAMTGTGSGAGMTAGGNIATGTAVQPTTGALASAAPSASGTGSALTSMGAQMSPVATGAGTGAGLAGTGATTAATGGTAAATGAATAGAGAGAGASGIGGALAALGPVGWAALAALALGAAS